MQIRVPESPKSINLDLVVCVEVDYDDFKIYFNLVDGEFYTWRFKSKERFNEVLEQIQSFYKEL